MRGLHLLFLGALLGGCSGAPSMGPDPAAAALTLSAQPAEASPAERGFPVLPVPGPRDPGPPLAAPRSGPADPIHEPPAPFGLPEGLPPTPNALVDHQPPPPAPSAETTAALATLLDPSDKQDLDKRHAALLLGVRGERAALAGLHEALVLERSPRVRVEVALALAALRDPASLLPLWDALRDRDPRVREAALHALGELGRAEAAPALRAFVAGGRGSEVAIARRALARLGQAPEEEAGVERLLDGTPLPPVTGGQTVYVDATTGTTGAAGTEEAPLRALSEAVLRLRPGAGDLLLATSGAEHVPFREEVDLLPQSGGNPYAPTILRAWPGRPPPILDGELAGAPGQPGMGIGLHVGASWVRIEGFIVRRYTDSCIDLSGSTGNVLIDCVAEDCGRHGLFVYYSPRSTLIDSRVRRSAAQGISVRSSPGTVVLSGLSVDNAIDGLLLLHDSDDVLIAGFAAHRNERGITFTKGSNRGRVIDGALDGNREGGIVVEPDSDATALRSGEVRVQ